MSGTEFTIALLDTVLWPSIVIFVLILFRQPIHSLIAHATRFSFKGMEVEFGKAVKSVSQQAEEALPDTVVDRKSRLLLSAHHFPNSTIRDAWNEVDDVAESLVRLYEPNIQLDQPDRYKRLEESLVNETLLDTKQSKLFSELRQLRNKVAHAEDFNVSGDDAVQYVELCFRLIEYLKAQVGQIATPRSVNAG